MRKIIPVIIGTMFTMPTFAISVAPVSGASVTDAGQYSGYTCVKVTGSGLPVTDTSLPTTDTSKCSATAAIAYQSNFSGGGVGSTVYQKRYCTACKSGYSLETKSAVSTLARDCKVTWQECDVTSTLICEGLECEGIAWWQNSSTTGNETRCNKDTNKCEYRCRSGYYDAGGMTIIGGANNCKACPTNANCTGGDTLPCCNVGYYMYNNNYNPSISGAQADYECLRCPALYGVYGTTTSSCPLVAPTPSDITRCFIPPNTDIDVTEGTFQFTMNCNYSE